MLSEKCLICDFLTDSKASFARHLQFAHKMKTEEYTIKYILNGEEPKCPICGIKPRYVGFSFKKYCKEHSNYASIEGGKIGGRGNKKEIVEVDQNEEKLKCCSVCHISKSPVEFNKDEYGKFGVSSTCKTCAKEFQKEYRKENTEKISEQKKQFYNDNKERIAEDRKEYYIENREKILLRTKEYTKNHVDFIKRYRQSIKGKWSYYKSSAKKRNLSFELTFEQFSSFWQKSCCYCGCEVNTICLDRIDSNKGYTVDNVVSSCVNCNLMKLDHTQEEFIQLCKNVVNFNNKNKIIDCEWK